MDNTYRAAADHFLKIRPQVGSFTVALEHAQQKFGCRDRVQLIEAIGTLSRERHEFRLDHV